MSERFDVIERMKELCSEKNLSFYRLSKISGIPASTLSNYLARGHVPSVNTIEKICGALDITLSQFFMGNDEMDYSLTQKQKELLEMYCSLSDADKELLFAYLSGLCHK